MWNEIKNESDIELFLNHVSYFHDSCIKEISYISGAYVDEDLSMYPVNSKRTLNIIIQRQSDTDSVIEMQFSGLKYLKLYPADVDYTCEILGCSMLIKDGFIYWCDEEDLTKTDEFDKYQGTAVCASNVKWRVLNDCLGNSVIYKNNVL